MVDVNKLKGKMVMCGLNVADVALKMNMNVATLYRKFNNNGATFTIKEATVLSTLLHLTSQEVNEIFFAEDVAYNAKKAFLSPSPGPVQE